MAGRLIYKRVLLKLSGEALAGPEQSGLDHAVLSNIIDEICAVRDAGVEVAIVIGGGNIFRGSSLSKVGVDRSTADYVGMLATIMNAVILQETLRSRGVPARAMSALNIEAILETYIRVKAMRYLEEDMVVIFAGGTGNPFFTTDTAAALRATEMGVEVLLKATKVDGVYSEDPMYHDNAIFYNELSFDDALKQNLGIMDGAALALCRDQKIPLIVFNIFRSGALLRIVQGASEGTFLHC